MLFLAEKNLMLISMGSISNGKYYMDVQLDFGEEFGHHGIEMDEKRFKYAITLAMKTLFGEMGYVTSVDVLKYREKDRRAFIRVPTSDLVKVWSSLSLFSRYDGLDCMFRVYKVTPVLCCLNLNSHLYEHKTAEDCPVSTET